MRSWFLFLSVHSLFQPAREHLYLRIKKNIETWGAKFLLWSKYSNPRVSCRMNCGGRVFICFSFSLSCWIYNSPECTGLVRYCPVHNIWGFGELNVIFFWIKSVFQPDSIHYCYAYVLYGPQQILVSYEISEGMRSVLFCKVIKHPSTKIIKYHRSDDKNSHIRLRYLQTALLFVPLMSWERWSRKTASTLKKQCDWGSISNRLDTSCFPNPKRRKCLQGFFMWNINSNLLYQSRTDWISSSSWLIRRRKSPWRIWTTEDLFQHW